MRIRFNVALLVLLAAGLMAGVLFAYGSASAGGGEEIGNTAPMYDFRDHGGVNIMFPQERGTSSLVRDLEGIAMSFDTSDLPVGAFTVWWVIFNEPSNCVNNDCGAADTVLGGPAEASVLWATAGIVGPDRRGHASARLKVGLENAPGYVHRGPGLTNPMGAEVHIIIKYHGPPQWDDPKILALQLTTFVGDCARLLCYLPQSAVHNP